MTTIVYTCDVRGCLGAFACSVGNDTNRAKRAAEQIGWQIDDHFGDLCPHCQKAQKSTPASPAKAQP